MITIDLVSGLMYGQLLLTAALLFFVQLLVIAARDKIEQVGDWLVYRGCWVGIAVQFVTMVLLAVVVFNFPTDHTEVTYTIVIILLNTVWFASMRFVFLLADILHRQE
jgi:hypothetical protein